jgi:hypothetical protein
LLLKVESDVKETIDIVAGNGGSSINSGGNLRMCEPLSMLSSIMENVLYQIQNAKRGDVEWQNRNFLRDG